MAVLARILWAFIYFSVSAGPPLGGRAFENVAIALSLLNGDGYSSPFFSDSGPTAFVTPIYPFFLAGVMAIFGTGTAAGIAVVIVQEIFSLLTVLLVMYTARMHFGERAANLAGLLMAVTPIMLLTPLMIWETCLSGLLLTCAFAAASSSMLERMKFIPAGVACAVAGLANPAVLPTFWGLCGWAAWKRKTFPWAGILAFFVVFSPWPVRNALVLHSFVPTRTNLGYELWMGNHPGGDGEFVASMNPMSNLAEHREFVRKGELAYFHEKGELAKAFIASHPLHFLWLDIKRIGEFWVGYEHGEGPATVPIFVLAAAGIVLVIKQKGPARLFAIPLVLYPLPYYITHADLRFQYVIDPVLLILAARAVDTLLIALRSERSDLMWRSRYSHQPSTLAHSVARVPRS